MDQGDREQSLIDMKSGEVKFLLPLTLLVEVLILMMLRTSSTTTFHWTSKTTCTGSGGLGGLARLELALASGIEWIGSTQRNYRKSWRRLGRRCRTGCRARPPVTRPGEPGRTRK